VVGSHSGKGDPLQGRGEGKEWVRDSLLKKKGKKKAESGE
jgi:hypothetical protein